VPGVVIVIVIIVYWDCRHACIPICMEGERTREELGAVGGTCTRPGTRKNERYPGPQKVEGRMPRTLGTTLWDLSEQDNERYCWRLHCGSWQHCRASP